MRNFSDLQNTSRTVLLSPPLKAILDSLSYGVTIVDTKGYCVYMNTTQKKHDGFLEITVEGQHITTLYVQHELDPIPIIECLDAGVPILRKSNWYKTLNNRLLSTINDFFPLFDNGKPDGAVVFTNWLDVLAISKNRNNLDSYSQPANKNELYTFECFFGRNKNFLSTIEKAKMAANSSSSVMIWGESGTGKELFAQAVHAHSKRVKQKFVPINCAAIPESLLEGILFGTTKGAYTDATDQAGLFELANGGTLLLDELNSMPLGLQAKLLRVIQEKSVLRLGSHTQIPINVRIISTLNKNPLDAIKEGNLRHDLFYRLAVVSIMIPPLRERQDDILLLAREFIDRSELSTKPCSIAISDEVIKMLQTYNWPGNVRELLNVMEGSLALLGSSPVITPEFLPWHFIEFFNSYLVNKDTTIKENNTCEMNTIKMQTPYFDYTTIKLSEKIPLKDCMQKYEFECISNVLQKTGGNIAKAARILNITSAGLHYKIKTLNIYLP